MQTTEHWQRVSRGTWRDAWKCCLFYIEKDQLSNNNVSYFTLNKELFEKRDREPQVAASSSHYFANRRHLNVNFSFHSFNPLSFCGTRNPNRIFGIYTQISKMLPTDDLTNDSLNQFGVNSLNFELQIQCSSLSSNLIEVIYYEKFSLIFGYG